MQFRRILMSITLACLLLAAVLPAQDFRATLLGTVLDPSGAAVPGATVKATNTATNVTNEVLTNSDGQYTIPYLTPGTYTVEAAAAGFQKLKREAIVLRVADKLNLALQLTIGQITQEVTVVGQQQIIETASADRGLVFDPIKVEQYPLNGRQTYMLMSLTPGVIFTQEQFGSSGFSGTRGWDVNSSYKINGARPGQNLFLLNGAPISDPGGSWQLAPNVEAVQEFKVMTNTYDAAYGRFGGGVVNTTLKSGSNSWHGNIFEYFRNRVFDANSFQSNQAAKPAGAPADWTAPKPYHNQHQFGGAVGGPIRKDKDFLFASFEGWQELNPFAALASTVPMALRDGQHFTDFGYKVFDPMTTHLCDPKTENCQGQTYIHNQFPNNVIPANRISPIGQKLLSYYPAPNSGDPKAVNNNFVGTNVGRYYYEQPIVKWDHVFGERDRINTTWTYQRGFEYRDSTGFGKPAANGNVNNERRDINVIVSWTHILSPTWVLDSRVSYGRFTQITPGYSDMTLTATSVGMTQMTRSPMNPYDIVPRLSVTGYNTIFSSGSVLSRSPRNQVNFAPNLSMSFGKHTLHTGFEFNYYSQGTYNTGATNVGFGTTWTQQLPSRQQNALDGSGLASLLLGTPTSGSIDYNDTAYGSRPYFAIYAQDDWRIRPSITLNLGLRYDVQIPFKERFNRVNRGWDPSVVSPLSDQIIAAWTKAKADYDSKNPTAKYPYPAPPKAIYGSFLFPGVNGLPERIYDTDWTNISPRIGLAWRVAKNTVIRTGAGVYYQSPTQTGTTTGFSQSTPYTTSLDGGLTPSAGLTGPYSMVNMFPQGLFVPQGAKGGALTGIGGGISFDPPRFKIPRTYQYSFGLQQSLGHKIVAEASYAGNYQIYINYGYDMNSPGMDNQLKAIADTSYYSRTLPNPFYGILPTTVGLGSSATTTATNLLRPFPIYSGGITNNLIQGGSHYRSDALQVKVEQRALGGDSKGILTWVLSYTFAKSYEQNHRLNTWNLAEEPIYEIDNNDKPQNVSFSGVYDLPFGKNRKMAIANPIVNTIAGDWRFTWIFTYLSGYPVGWPDLINNCGGKWKVDKQTEDAWFNNDKTCYAQRASNTLRTIPDRFPDVRNPAEPQLNLALEKTFHFTERYRFLFRGEAFNATNTPIRPGPNTSFTSVDFGKLPKSQQNFPRFFQIAAKFYF